MALASRRLIDAIRATARRLESERTEYRWSHFAHCNCGQLAQTLTGWSPEALYRAAAAQRGDWAEQARAARKEWPDCGNRRGHLDEPDHTNRQARLDDPDRGNHQAHLDDPDGGNRSAHVEWPDYGDRPPLDEGAWQPEDLGACTVSQRTMSELFDILAQWGLSAEDIAFLERLEDPVVRRHLGTNTVPFHHSDRENVIAYLRAWAEVLETKLLEAQAQPDREAQAARDEARRANDDAQPPLAAE